MGLESDHRDLAMLLARLGAQLHEVNRLGQTVEEAIGDLIRHTNHSGMSPASSFQSLDVLVQSIDSLAVYVEALAAAVPEGTRIDAQEAMKRVKLRALSHALTALEHPDDLTPPADHEDLHLF